MGVASYCWINTCRAALPICNPKHASFEVNLIEISRTSLLRKLGFGSDCKPLKLRPDPASSEPNDAPFFNREDSLAFDTPLRCLRWQQDCCPLCHPHTRSDFSVRAFGFFFFSLRACLKHSGRFHASKGSLEECRGRESYTWKQFDEQLFLGGVFAVLWCVH